jgi:hypothetical protein
MIHERTFGACFLEIMRCFQVINKVLISVVCEKTASSCWCISEE